MTRVVVEHMAGAIALPWRYCVEDAHTRQTFAGQCPTRGQAYAVVRAALVTISNRRWMEFYLDRLRGEQPQNP